MSSILTGAYGYSYDVHLYFINAVFAYLLKPFYILQPGISWYYVAESFEVFVAFWCFNYVLLKKLGVKVGLLFCLLLQICVLPEFFPNVDFTRCASALTASAAIMLVLGNNKKCLSFLLIGSLLAVGGFVMRNQMFLLGVPCFILLSLYTLYRGSKLYKPTIAFLILIAVSIFALKTFDHGLYQSEDFKYYAAYQGPRAVFGDGAYYSSEGVYDELEERGKHGYDYKALTAWMYYDTEVLALDSLRSIINIVNRNLYDLNYARLPVSIILAICKSLTCSASWCWLALCLATILFPYKKSSLYPWLSLALISLSLGYMLLVNRFAAHVEVGSWLYAIVLAVPAMDKDAFKRCKAFNILIVLLAFATILGFSLNALHPLLKRDLSKGFIETSEQTEEWLAFEEYAREHNMDVFLLSFNNYKNFAVNRDVPYKAIKPGSWQNIYPLGYWNVHLPAMKQELALRGVQNPIRDIINKNVYVIEDKETPSLAWHYQTHYNASIVADTIKRFGYINLLKYKLKEAAE